MAIIKLLNRIIKLKPRGKVHLILDNATYYHADIIKDWKSHHHRVKFHFIPPYSPNLNLIERLWRFFHQKVTNNHYFETYAEFKCQLENKYVHDNNIKLCMNGEKKLFLFPPVFKPITFSFDDKCMTMMNKSIYYGSR